MREETMSRPDFPQYPHRRSTAGDTRRSVVSDIVVWSLGLVPMTWGADDRSASDAFTRVVPGLFPKAAERTADADPAGAPDDQSTNGSLYARQYARKIIDDTLALLGKKGTFAVSGGRLTVYCPTQRLPDDRRHRGCPE
jgi:hypothetical protein